MVDVLKQQPDVVVMEFLRMSGGDTAVGALKTGGIPGAADEVSLDSELEMELGVGFEKAW